MAENKTDGARAPGQKKPTLPAFMLATRFYGDTTDPATRDRLIEWFRWALSIKDVDPGNDTDVASRNNVLIMIATDEQRGSGTAHGVREILAGIDADNQVEVLPITRWGPGRFVGPLNELLYEAARRQCAQIFYCSLEMRPEINQVVHMRDVMNEHLAGGKPKTLVIGALTTEHGTFLPHTRDGVERLTCHTAAGDQIPWNTCAMWSVAKLGPYGFLLVGDAPGRDPSESGVEEIATMAMLQRLHGIEQAEVVLTAFGKRGAHIDMTGWSSERIAAHTRKIASKVLRADRHLTACCLNRPVVVHLLGNADGQRRYSERNTTT